MGVLIRSEETQGEKCHVMTDVAEVCLQSTEHKVTGSHMRLEDAGKGPALEPSGGAWPCPHLDFRCRAPELGDTICQPPLSLFQQDLPIRKALRSRGPQTGSTVMSCGGPGTCRRGDYGPQTQCRWCLKRIKIIPFPLPNRTEETDTLNPPLLSSKSFKYFQTFRKRR